MKMKFTALNLIISSLLLSACQTIPPQRSVQSAGPITGEVIEYGIYEKQEDEGVPWVNPVSTTPIVYEGGTKHTVLEKTNLVPAAIGRGFSVKYLLKGLPEGKVELDWTLKHPQMIKPNGELSTGYSYKRPVTVVNGVSAGQFGYFFENDYELVEGNWEMIYSYHGQQVLKMQFITTADSTEHNPNLLTQKSSP